MNAEQLARWGRSLTAGSERLQCFVNARDRVVVCIGGAIGSGFSLLAGTAWFWASISMIVLPVFLVMARLQRRRMTGGGAGALVMAPFLNQFMFVSLEIYAAIILTALVGLFLPPLLRLAGWGLIALANLGDVTP